MSRTLGKIIQSGFVVDDWESAARHWSEVMGVGPFFVIRKIDFKECYYRGEPIEPDLTVAIAYSGSHQIELSQQNDDGPSIYRDFLAHNAPGLQHVGSVVDDLDKVIEDNNFRDQVIQHGETTTGMRFAYVETGHHNGTMIELLQSTPQLLKAFDYMYQASVDWDGSDPIRG
ncbi:MAG: VOC family protein [Gammaproteobacteria bacterium]